MPASQSTSLVDLPLTGQGPAVTRVCELMAAQFGYPCFADVNGAERRAILDEARALVGAVMEEMQAPAAVALVAEALPADPVETVSGRAEAARQVLGKLLRSVA